MAISLVDAAKQGDDLAFEGLLEPLLEPGYRLACGICAMTIKRRSRSTRRSRWWSVAKALLPEGTVDV